MKALGSRQGPVGEVTMVGNPESAKACVTGIGGFWSRNAQCEGK